jgi:hypothetical protein
VRTSRDLTTIDLDVIPKDHNFQEWAADVFNPEPLRPGAGCWPLTQNPIVTAMIADALAVHDGLPMDKFLCKSVDVVTMVDMLGLDPSYAKVSDKVYPADTAGNNLPPQDAQDILAGVHSKTPDV